MKKPISTYILIFLVFFQFIGAVPSGLSMVIDPSGKSLGIPLYLLEQSPFINFLIPGLFLFIVLGLFPGLIIFGLIKKPLLSWAQKLNLDRKVHWSCTFSCYLGIILILWIITQLVFDMGFHILHFVYLTIGVLMVVLSQWPSNKKYYQIDLLEKAKMTNS